MNSLTQVLIASLTLVLGGCASGFKYTPSDIVPSKETLDLKLESVSVRSMQIPLYGSGPGGVVYFARSICSEFERCTGENYRKAQKRFDSYTKLAKAPLVTQRTINFFIPLFAKSRRESAIGLDFPTGDNSRRIKITEEYGIVDAYSGWRSPVFTEWQLAIQEALIKSELFSEKLDTSAANLQVILWVSDVPSWRGQTITIGASYSITNGETREVVFDEYVTSKASSMNDVVQANIRDFLSRLQNRAKRGEI